MRIVLLITLIESALIAVLMIVWRSRRSNATAPVPVRVTESPGSATNSLNAMGAARWAFINDWRVEPQADDRIQTSGQVARSTEPAPGRRSATRRRHQAMYKQWSRNRHD